MMDCSKYRTIVFDCDGVVLNSNKVKTLAFYEATKHFGSNAAQRLVDYHVQNGGISRYIKFEYFMQEILNKPPDQSVIDDLLNRFSMAVKQGLLQCEIASGLKEFRKQTETTNWLIVSGGDQAELRAVFSERSIDQLYNGGIFGSPDPKDKIFQDQKAVGNIEQPCLFLGDSKYDYLAAQNAGVDFVFISDWTEVTNWQDWAVSNDLQVVNNIKELVV